MSQTINTTDKRWQETMIRLDKIIKQMKEDHQKFLEARKQLEQSAKAM